MNRVKQIAQGVLIGIASILPGVSGGMIAASFNIYAKLINALDNFTKHPIKAILSIWEYLLGIAVGLLVGLLVIKFIFVYIPIPATLLFIGLIVGGIPDIYLYAKTKNFKLQGIIIVAVTAVLMIGLIFVLNNIPKPSVEDTKFYLWIIVGGLIVLSLIIPGLSGTMLMMMIGYYTPLVYLGSDFVESIYQFDFSTFFYLLPTFLWIFLGFAVVGLLSAKLLNIVIKKKEHIFYQIVLGIMISSPVSIIISLDLELQGDNVYIFDFKNEWYMWIIGLILVPVGIFLARVFSKKETKEEALNETPQD